MEQPKIKWTKKGVTAPKKREYSEFAHQRAVVAWMRLQHPHLARLMTLGSFGENIGQRRMGELKLLGLTPGHCDLVLYIPRLGFSGLHIEMKKPGGKVAPHQKEIHTLLRQQNYKVEVCYSSDDAINILKEYLSSAIVS